MTRLTPNHKDAASQIMPVIDALKQALGESLVSVILFGSRARGNATETSDWDLLVIARHLPEKPFERHLHLKNIVPEIWRGQVAIVAKTPQEFESYLPSFYLDIALDGIILYDTDRYITKRLFQLQQLIKAKGLQREQLGNDLIWEWQEFPGYDWSVEWESVG
ncbi:MAG TPA: nucleotidyltransferase domain-containing protein [Anaerolineae bacterium]